VQVDQDEIEDDQGLAWYQGEPFTGEVVERGPDGRLITLYTYVMGNEDGPYQEWYPDDRLYKEGSMRLGLPVGTHRRWYPNGRLAEESVFDDRGDQLARRRWDEAGNLLPGSFTRPSS
jgi:antitoxin component YwqK of YwqJK toxin-antitoxin module